MYRCMSSPDLQDHFPNHNNNRGKKGEKSTQPRASTGQRLPSTQAQLQLTPVRIWRPAQQEVIRQLKREGIIGNYPTVGGGQRKARVPRPQRLTDRLEKVHKTGSSLEERLELATMLREKALWNHGAMARQSDERRARIVDMQNKIQNEKRQQMEEKLRRANERKKRLIQGKVANRRRRDLMGWGELE